LNTDLKRSLIVAPQWIGDAVMSEPLLALLATRGERLTVGALPHVAPVYRAMPQVEAVLEWRVAQGRLDVAERLRVARELRGRFDNAYVLPNSIKSALIPFLARIPRRVGYRGEGRWLLLGEQLPNPVGRAPMVDAYAALAGMPTAVVRKPRLALDPAVQSGALAKYRLEQGAYWAFAPGAEYGPAKCWPASHYAALAVTLHAQYGLPVVLLGSSKESALAAHIAASTTARCLELAGKTSLMEAMALIASARGTMSNDSGLMHIAAAFGVPQVAVFGSTSPLHTPPLNARARVLWLKDELRLDCMPCFERACRYGHARCLTAVSSERAAEALEAVVE